MRIIHPDYHAWNFMTLQPKRI